MTTTGNGRFQPGNQAAVGHSSRSQKLRNAMLTCITELDVQAVTARLIDMARDGSLPAMKLLFDLIGKPTAATAAMPAEPAVDKSEEIARIATRIRLSREAESA